MNWHCNEPDQLITVNVVRVQARRDVPQLCLTLYMWRTLTNAGV